MMTGLCLIVLLGGCITPVLLPKAAFTFNPASGESPLSVTFDASQSQAPGDTTITTFAWDFGDGTTGQGMITGHSYQTDVERQFIITLVITDQLGRQASAIDEITVTPASSAPPASSIEFVWPFHYDASGDDAANLNDEYFTLQNTGDENVDVSGWTVENERGVTFRIPNGVVLAPNATITIHSGSGANTSSVLYWNASEPLWNNNSDLAFLRDARGTYIDHYGYNSCGSSHVQTDRTGLDGV